MTTTCSRAWGVPQSQNKKDSRNILSSSGVAVFVSEANDKEHWIEAGRCYERFALQATALNLRSALYRHIGWTPAGMIPEYALDPDRTPHDAVIFYKKPDHIDESWAG
jgi:hypothetical protein